MDTGCIADGLSPLHLLRRRIPVKLPFPVHTITQKTEDLVNALFLNAPPNQIPQCSLHGKLVLKDANANGCFFKKEGNKEKENLP